LHLTQPAVPCHRLVICSKYHLSWNSTIASQYFHLRVLHSACVAQCVCCIVRVVAPHL
jgi:hypothetical protein